MVSGDDELLPWFSSAVPQDAMHAWRFNNGNAFWPAPAFGFQDKRVQVFWDMENCTLNAEYPPRPPGDGRISAQQHYDLLIAVFATMCGVRMADFHLHVGIAQDNLARLNERLSKNIQQRHSSWVSVCAPLGKTAQKGAGTKNKEDLFGLDVFLIDLMDRYITSGSRPSDVLVLISGDAGYLPILRKAHQQGGLQVLHLYTGQPAAEYNTDNRFIRWRCEWRAFLQKHKRHGRPDMEQRAFVIRNTALEIAQHQGTIGDLGLVFLVDATGSMRDVMDEVKEKLSKELMLDLFIRYPWLKDKVWYNVLAYRDVSDKCDPSNPADKKLGHFQTLRPDGKFTQSVEEVQNFFATLKAGGGGDEPEDVAGALLEAAKRLDWNPNCTNIIYHVFDAPGHGKQFNDRYPGAKDYYYDSPPPDRKDPAEEIKEAVSLLMGPKGVNKYYMLTIKRNKLKPSTTAKTVEGVKEIVAAVPAVEGGQGEGWLQDVNMGDDAVPLIRVMIQQTSRTLAGAVSQSRHSASLRASMRMKEKVLDMQTITELTELEEASAACAGRGGGTVTLVKASTANEALDPIIQRVKAATPPATASGSGATPLPKTPRQNLIKPSSLYSKWSLHDGAPSLVKMMNKFKHHPRTELGIRIMAEPDDMQDLMERIDSFTALDTIIPAVKNRHYKILPKPFAQGEERVCFLAQEMGMPGLGANAGQLQVLKEFRHQGKAVNCITRYEKFLASHTVSKFLAHEFNTELDARNVPPGSVQPERIQYVDPCIVRGMSNEGHSINRFQERFIVGRFRKFTNNCGYVAPLGDYIDVCDAFAHWTYVRTGKRLMVTDVQGWYDEENKLAILTDPCVHCSSQGLVDDAVKDFGLPGMEEYFCSHVCGTTCEAMGLASAAPVCEVLADLRARILRLMVPRPEDEDKPPSAVEMATPDTTPLTAMEHTEERSRILGDMHRNSGSSDEDAGVPASGGRGGGRGGGGSPNRGGRQNGRGGGHKGRGTGRGGGAVRRCRFFAMGNCRYEDKCQFRH